MEARIKIPENIKPFLEAEYCKDFNIERYYITETQTEIYNSIMRTAKLSKEMQELGLVYPNTTLLYGPSGTGKTQFGRFVAYMLDKDFVYVDFSRLIGGIMGDTARNISDIFRFMEKADCIFMFDEIDCVATKRGTESAATGGELSRITITIMQELDHFKKKKTNAILIAATNRFDQLDDALKTRFSIKRKIPALSNDEKIEYIFQFLNNVPGVEYNDNNIRNYVSDTVKATQRTMEADMIQCIANWIENGKKDFYLKHIKEELEY